MSITVADYVRVDQRIIALGCQFPDGIAVLPTNFETATNRSDFRQLSEAATIRALFRNNNILLGEVLPHAEKAPYIQNNNFDWVAPTLFISSAFLTQDPVAISVALNVLGNYVTDLFRGFSSKKAIKLDIVVERTKDHFCKKITYEGDVQGLNSLADIVRQVSDE